MMLLTATTGRASVLTGPVFNPANGHVYYLLTENSWTASEAEAEALGGTLAIINDPAENAWIYSKFSMFGNTPRGLWIGLTDKDREGTFVWVTGDPLVYINWGGGEPANQDGNDDYVHIFWPGDGREPGWNDAPDMSSLSGVVEISPTGSWVFCSGESVWENEGQAKVSVMLLRGTNVTDLVFSVDYATVDGTAHAGEDYAAASGTLQFAVGETNKQIAIQILNDGLKEPQEQFRLVLSNPTGGVSLGNSNVVIRIQDNDPGVRFMTENVAVSETAGVVRVGVLRGDDLNLPFTVDYLTTDDTARAGEDYVTASGTLQFAAGETNKQIAITVLDDGLSEPWEHFRLVLSNLSGGVSLENQNVVIRIVGDELTTYYVNVHNPNPAFPYTSWASAATDIQDAVDAAHRGDTVLVTNGVYAVGSRDVLVWQPTWEPPQFASKGLSRVVITNAIRLESVNGPLVTTIEGDCTRDEDGYVIDTRRCVYLGSNAVLSGFTLTNGHAHWQNGGGVYSEPSGVVTNCVVTGNTSIYGGGGGGVCGGTLYNCVLRRNSAIPSGRVGTGQGGGAYNSALYNCTLTGNSAPGGGGAFESTLYNCTLTGNSAYYYDGGGAFGCTLYNCLVNDNDGGGVWDCTLFNCTVTGNDGGGVARAWWSEEGSTLYNSIVYYNFGGNYPEGTILNYSCTSPLPTNGVGNITGHPLFMDMEAGDFRLREESPCIDAGMNLMGFTLMATNVDTGEIYVAASYSHDPTDILGNTRFIDGNFDGRVAWDIGAYEFNSFRPPQFTCAPQRMPDRWRLSITGAPNKWVHVQRSSDLKNWEDCWSGWMGAAGVKQVDDTDMSPKAMFYRAVVGQ